MSPSKLKNFRFDEHYAGLLSFLAQRFNTTESELIRRTLDHVNMEYGLALKLAERFIQQLTERHGSEARLEFRLIPSEEALSDVPSDVLVLVDGEPDEGLLAQLLAGSSEERVAGVERCRIVLLPHADSEYIGSARGQYTALYIGELDPASPASLSIRVGDLRKEMQIFGWMSDWQRDYAVGEGIEEVERAFVLDAAAHDEG